MQLRQTLGLTLILDLLCLVSSAQGLPNARTTPNLPQKSIPTMWSGNYLPKMADRLNCYYTMETRQTKTGNTGDDVYFTDDPSVTTLAAFVKQLRKEATGFVVLPDKANPHVIHLIDAELYHDAKYPINQKVSISYTGFLWSLPDALGKKMNAPLITQRVFLSGINAIDYTTKGKVLVTNANVRSILTDCVPLAHYNHFIWTAETFPVEGKPRTQVSYSGQVLENAR